MLGACGALTREEARETLDEIELSSQAQALTAGAIELSAEFTIGEGPQSAGEELRDFIAAELPCAEVALSAGQLSIEYGAKPGSCSYRGQRYRGQHMAGVEMRWIDPVPQAGRYTLDTPYAESLSAAFTRSSAATIRVTIAGKRRAFDFDVYGVPTSDTTE